MLLPILLLILPYLLVLFLPSNPPSLFFKGCFVVVVVYFMVCVCVCNYMHQRTQSYSYLVLRHCLSCSSCYFTIYFRLAGLVALGKCPVSDSHPATGALTCQLHPAFSVGSRDPTPESLAHVTSTFTHGAIFLAQFHFSLQLNKFISFLHSSLDRHPGWFHFLAIADTAE